MNAAGSTVSGLKLYSGNDTTGVSGSVTINYSAADFSGTPAVFVNPTNGSLSSLSVSSVGASSFTVSSSPVNTTFNYFAIGT